MGREAVFATLAGGRTRVKRRFVRVGIVFAVTLVFSGAAEAGSVPSSGVHRAPEAVTRLISEMATVRPGERLTMAIEQTLSPGWHTYWRNPRDSGEAMQVDWRLPEAAEASAISWPVPERIAAGPIMTYGYEGTVRFLSEISVPATWPAGKPFPVSADLLFLVCSEICIPVQASLQAAVATGPASRADEAVKVRFRASRERLPSACPWAAAAEPDGRSIRLTLRAGGSDFPAVEDAYFFAEAWGLVEHAGTQKVMAEADKLVLTLPGRDTPYAGALSGVVALKTVGEGNTAPSVCRIDTGIHNTES